MPLTDFGAKSVGDFVSAYVRKDALLESLEVFPVASIFRKAREKTLPYRLANSHHKRKLTTISAKKVPQIGRKDRNHLK